MSLFTAVLKDITEKTIPMTLAVPKRFNKPWFSETCIYAMKERYKVLEKFKREPTEDNLNAYRIARAIRPDEIHYQFLKLQLTFNDTHVGYSCWTICSNSENHRHIMSNQHQVLNTE